MRQGAGARPRGGRATEGRARAMAMRCYGRGPCSAPSATHVQRMALLRPWAMGLAAPWPGVANGWPRGQGLLRAARRARRCGVDHSKPYRRAATACSALSCKWCWNKEARATLPCCQDAAAAEGCRSSAAHGLVLAWFGPSHGLDQAMVWFGAGVISPHTIDKLFLN